jgi:RHS repeat-associated protein
MGNQANASADAIPLPKGGGALQGLGEKFSPDLHTGTGNFSIPIALPPGRNGFQPQLALGYSTGSGNSPFGLGWSLSVPAITRKTSSGVPRYRDGAVDPREHDTFVLSGSEDLVRVSDSSERIRRYRPRTEGLFACIEHHLDKGIWKVQTKDGLVSIYGAYQDTETGAAIIADPEHPGRVFAWKLAETCDPFGNHIRYEYLRDTGSDPFHRWDQLLLHRIHYMDYKEDDRTRFLVSVELDYEERPDPCSDHRAGFEIRTRKRCRQILIRTHTGQDQLVRTYTLQYLDARVGAGELPATLLPANGVSLLSRVQVTGHDGERSEALPPIELGYTRFQPEARDLFPLTGRDLPAGSLADRSLALVDLFGHGLQDILEMGEMVRFWRNRGDGTFDMPRPMAAAPADLRLDAPGVVLMDANGDSRADLMVWREGMAGYFPLRFGATWDRRSFRRYEVAPSFNLDDPEVSSIDLNGDGVADAIRSGTRMECFFNDPEKGWHEARVVERRALAEFPDITFSDPRVRHADLTGDGLHDIVLIHDGRVEYWPSRGWGDWGRRVLMRNSPRFPEGYNPAHILLCDVDGDGLADLIHVENTRVTLWINRCGNSWSEPIVIRGTPPLADGDSVCTADVLGTGIGGILWSFDAGRLPRERLMFLQLAGAPKPYLLDRMDNHCGAVTEVSYAPSTRFLLADAAAGRPWRTPLPFPVQVVEKTVVTDAISGGRLVTEYSYHHGYWDGAEREFRGFARVDQRDTETFERFRAAVGDGAAAEQRFSPPIETRTWFHPGPVDDAHGDWEVPDYSAEHWHEPGTDRAASGMLARSVETEALLASLPRRAARDACRALRGRVLRSELYALDGSALAGKPYTVTERRYALREESAPADPRSSRLRIFFPHEVASRTTEWERGDDPMTRFAFTGDHDDFGQPRASLAVAVPRGRDPRSEAAWNEPYLATLTVTAYAAPASSGPILADRVAHVTTYELAGVRTGSVQSLREAVFAGAAVPERKVIAQTLSFYDGAAFEGLPLGQVGSTGARVRSEQLVLTPTVLAEAYGDMLPFSLGGPGDGTEPAEWRAMLPAGAGHVRRGAADGAPYIEGLYIESERHEYDLHRAGEPVRGLVRCSRDPLGNETQLAYDRFGFLPVQVTDAAGLITRADYDYRVLQPWQVTDPNGNRQRFAFSSLGLPERALIMGKEGEVVGDTPEAPSIRYVYDFDAFAQRGEPISVRTIRRVWHALDASAPAQEYGDVLETVEYTDGLGRLLQTRALAEDTLVGDPVFGGGVLPADQEDRSGTRAVVSGVTRAANGPPNVVVSGWQRYDNKGRVVEKWEPFFSTGWAYRSPDAERDAAGHEVRGRKAVLFYDTRGRMERTINPDGSEQRVVYGVPGELAAPERFAPTPWEVFTYDANDNAGRTHAGASSAGLYRHHWDTPTSARIDALGRTVESVQRNRVRAARPGDPLPAIEELRIQTTYDIRGNVLTVTDELGRLAFRHVYDLASRPLRVESIDAGTRSSTLDAAGRPMEASDSKGARTFRAHDVLHRPVRLWARDGGSEAVTLRERLVYGDAPEAGEGGMAANRLGRLFKHYDEAGLVTIESYDFKGNITAKTRRVVRHDHVLSVVQPAGQEGWLVQAWRMDWTPPPRLTIEQHAANLLADTEYRSSSRYDALGRAVAIQMPLDVEGTRKEMRARFNRSGALEGVTLDGRVYVEYIAYNARRQRTLIAHGNGVMTRHAYDPDTFRLVRLRSERYRRVAGATGLAFQPVDPDRPLQDMAYGHDLAGNMLAISDRTPGGGLAPTPDRLDRAFTYDALYRLLEGSGREAAFAAPSTPWDGAPRSQDPTATRAYSERYTYDAAGNLTRLAHGSDAAEFARAMALVPGTNRLATMTTGQTVHAYAYDPSGNMVRENEARWFEWDHSNRMRVFRTQTRTRTPRGEVRWAEPSVHAHYLYDASGERVAKMVRRQSGKSEITIYVNGLFEHHVQVPNGRRPKPDQENNTLHVMDGVQRIAAVRVGRAFADETAPEHAVKYHLGDHLGSSHVVVSGDGTWLNREEYTPYGESSFGSFARKRYRYTGKERDEESGLSYHGARYYAPWLCRWTACDPAGTVDSVNLYMYGRANPLTLTDSTGLASENPPLTNEQVTQTQLQTSHSKTSAQNVSDRSALMPESKPAPKINHTAVEGPLTCEAKLPLDPSEWIEATRRKLLDDFADNQWTAHAIDLEVTFTDIGDILDNIANTPDLTELERAYVYNQIAYSLGPHGSKFRLSFMATYDLSKEYWDSYRTWTTIYHVLAPLGDPYHGSLGMMCPADAERTIWAYERQEGGPKVQNAVRTLNQLFPDSVPSINCGDINASRAMATVMRAYINNGFKFKTFAETWKTIFRDGALCMDVPTCPELICR